MITRGRPGSQARINLPPGMLCTISLSGSGMQSGEPLELAGSEPVEQQPWQEFGIGGGDSPIKYKYVSLHDGPGPAPEDADTLYFEAAPSRKADALSRRTQLMHDLDYPHMVTFSRGAGRDGASSGSFDITGQGKAGRVFSHAMHAIRELAIDYRPMDMHFTAAEDSRVNAYKHLMHRLSQDPEMKHYVFLSRRGTAGRPESGSFYIVHRAVAHLPQYREMEPLQKKSASEKSPPLPQTAAEARASHVIPAGAPFANNLPPGMQRMTA